MKFDEFLRRICPVSDRVAHDQLRFTVENLQQAHRHGWEQAKMEAVAVVHAMEKVFHPSQIITDRCANAVTAMVYKEEEK